MSRNASSNSKIGDNVAQEFSELFKSELFASASDDVKKATIENITISKQKENGLMGILLGSKMPNIAVYSALILCISLIIMSTLIAFFCNCSEFFLELLKIIVPVITMSLGYMFGKKDTHEK